MKQPQYSPLTNAEIVCIIYAGTKGYLDKLEVNQVGRFEEGLLNHLRSKHQDLLDFITDGRSRRSPGRPRTRSRPRWTSSPRTSHKEGSGMPSLKDLKNRIESVKSTRKITKAMQMVAAAKLRRAQESAEMARPYTERFNAVMGKLAASVGDSETRPRFWQAPAARRRICWS